MKTCVVPDLHGLSQWELVKELTDIDKYVFIGDYVDSYFISNMQILENLKNIIQFKRENKDKVELLLGNHCLQYMYHPYNRCSGFRAEMLPDLKQLFNENRDIFNISYQYNNYIFTHAGISKDWFNHNLHTLRQFGLLDDLSNLSNTLNDINLSSNNWILHIVGQARGGLRYDYGGPTWADKSETENKIIDNLHQIVGHTPVDNITKNIINDNTSITYIDVFGKKLSKNEIITINDILIIEI